MANEGGTVSTSPAAENRDQDNEGTRDPSGNKRPLDDTTGGNNLDDTSTGPEENQVTENVHEKKPKQIKEDEQTESEAKDTNVNQPKVQQATGPVKGTTEKPDSSPRPWSFRSAISSTFNYFRGEARDKAYWMGLSLEEKRKKYRCGDKFMTLENILTWPQLSQRQSSQSTERRGEGRGGGATKISPDPILNSKISLWNGDITRLEIDAIVNAANSSLMGGGGVDGAIHSAAGNSLRDECSELGGCRVGNAKTTTGHRLPAKYIIHTVGPMNEDEQELTSCYEKCLDEVIKNGIRSVSFCCIATGVYGFPNVKAAHIALGTVRQWLNNDDNHEKVDRIIFTVFLKKDYQIYLSLLPIYFPLDESEISSTDTHPQQQEMTSHDIIPSLQKQPSEPARGAHRSGLFSRQDDDRVKNNSGTETNQMITDSSTANRTETKVITINDPKSSADAKDNPTQANDDTTHANKDPAHVIKEEELGKDDESDTKEEDSSTNTTTITSNDTGELKAPKEEDS